MTVTFVKASASLADRPCEPMRFTVFPTIVGPTPWNEQSREGAGAMAIAWSGACEGTNYSGAIVRGVGTHHQYLVTLSGLGQIWLLDRLDDWAPDELQLIHRVAHEGERNPTYALNPRTTLALLGLFEYVSRQWPLF